MFKKRWMYVTYMPDADGYYQPGEPREYFFKWQAQRAVDNIISQSDFEIVTVKWFERWTEANYMWLKTMREINVDFRYPDMINKSIYRKARDLFCGDYAFYTRVSFDDLLVKIELHERINRAISMDQT